MVLSVKQMMNSMQRTTETQVLREIQMLKLNRILAIATPNEAIVEEFNFTNHVRK
jgi:hypothetical protein